jgi:polysaccharide chain length determinant protein (PEP-CTERM system associated)
MVLLTYAAALWRRRWQGAVVAWLFCLAGWAFVMQLPNIYQATARIYVDTDSMLRPLMRGIAVDSNILNEVDLMQRTLLSRPNLLRVLHLSDLDLGAKTQADTEDLLTDLQRRITVSSEGRNLFSLAYSGPNVTVAKKVVQSLLTVFVESNLGNSRKDMVSARNFIDEQLHDYERQLDAADKRMSEFKAKNIGFLPGDNNFSTKLEAAAQELARTQAELEESKQKKEELTKQLATIPKTIETTSAGPDIGAGPPISDDTGSGSGSEASARVTDLERQIKVLLDTYTPLHPDVVRLQKRLDQAKQEAKEEKEKKEKEAAEAPKTDGDTPAVDPRATHNTAPNPTYESLTLQMVTLQTTIASLESRLQRNAAEVEKWRKLAVSVPEVAAQMAKLNRDYDVIHKAYDELLNRREAAKIGNDLETQTQTVQFRIIDPPDAPTAPIGPKRLLFLSMVLVAGIAAGGAFAFLLAQMDDSIATMRQLKDLVAWPVLGAVSSVSLPFERRRRRMTAIAFAVSCVVLVTVYVGLVSAEMFLQLRA